MTEVYRIVGIDPGKERDYFAMVVILVRDKKIYVLGAKRWPLGTPYYQVEEDLAQIDQKYPDQLYVVEKNNTGANVIEVLRDQKGLHVLGVTTSNNLKNPDRFRNTMDKNAMVLQMKAWFDEERIEFPRDNAEISELKRQLSNYSKKITQGGSVSYGASGQEHDDLVMALMLACFAARKYLKPGSRRHFATSSRGTEDDDYLESRFSGGVESTGRDILMPKGPRYGGYRIH